MTTFLRFVLEAIALFAVAWVLIFGAIGAILAHRRHGSAPVGMLLGSLLGPVGWAVVLLRTRNPARAALAPVVEPRGWETL